MAETLNKNKEKVCTVGNGENDEQKEYLEDFILI